MNALEYARGCWGLFSRYLFFVIVASAIWIIGERIVSGPKSERDRRADVITSIARYVDYYNTDGPMVKIPLMVAEDIVDLLDELDEKRLEVEDLEDRIQSLEEEVADLNDQLDEAYL